VRRSKLDLAQMAAAFLLPLVLVAAAGWFSWSQTWERAEAELVRSADGAAEYAQRMFASAVLAGRLTNSLLEGASDDDIRQNEAGYHESLAQIMPDLPGAITITVSDGQGQLLLISTEYPAPRLSVADPEWVAALQEPGAPDVYVGALAEGRVRGRLFFSISLPRTRSGNSQPEGAYDGLLTISLDPHVIAAGLLSTSHEQDDVIALLRSDGHILSTTRGLRFDIPRIPATSPLLAAIEAGQTRGMYEGQSLGMRSALPAGRGLLIAFRQVGTLPVYVTVSRTPQAVLAPWWRTLAGLLAVGLPASLALGLLSLTAVRRRNALTASQAELAASFDSAAIGMAMVDDTERRILKVNRRLCEMSGRDEGELTGMTLHTLLRPATPGTDDVDDAELWIMDCPNGSPRWVECTIAPVTRTHPDAPATLVATVNDITERKESQQRQALLSREVDHRAKNVLAIVRAVIRLASGPETAPFADKIEGRVKALARAHELLARDRWEGTDLGDLIRDELAPYRDGARVTISGSVVRIAPAAVQPLSMALHELATNALKHGALGPPEGSVSVSWARTLDARLVLNWDERTDRPPKVDPDSRGAGLRILRGSVEQLGGTVEQDWRATGLACTITLPPETLAAEADPASGKAVAANTPEGPAPRRSLAGLRVLLVEDEVLLAMDLHETLTAQGCEVIGPASTLKAAWALARQHSGRIDVAVLDMNLHGVTTLELARHLHGEGAICIFVSGYSELPDEADASWVLLRKPVDAQQLASALQAAPVRFSDVREAQASGAG
jgi:PAS domain S-box-containing protein